MLFLALAIIVKGGDSGNTLRVFNPNQTSWLGVTGGGVLGGILIGILLFVGFEAAASIGGESVTRTGRSRAPCWAPSPRRQIFFVIMAYAITIGYGRTRSTAASGSPTRRTWTQWQPAMSVPGWRPSSTWSSSWTAMGLALAICVTIGRGYFALGRDGLLPKFFAKTSRHDTPWVGNLVIVVGWMFPVHRGPIHGLDGHVGHRTGHQGSPPSSSRQRRDRLPSRSCT
jgi:amino acid transporter